MSIGEISRRFRALQKQPTNESKVLIVTLTYEIKQVGEDEAFQKANPVLPDYLKLILDSGQEFIIEREGQSLEQVAEKVSTAYPYGVKTLMPVDAATAEAVTAS